MEKNRVRRTRLRLKSRTNRLRLSVFVSNKHVFAQVIDDAQGKTLAAAKDFDVELSGKTVEVSKKVGELLAKRAKEKGVKQVVFDRGKKKYHGRVKALADAARAGGLEF